MERKEEIILAALELASGNGLKSVSMARIAEKVSIKAPSLYNHFKSKEELIKAMYSYLREKAQQNRSSGLADPMDFASKSLEESLMESLSAYLKMKNDGIDMAAMSFALTVHSLIDYRMDMITAGKAERFGDGKGPYTKELADYIKWFSKQAGGEKHEQKTH